MKLPTLRQSVYFSLLLITCSAQAAELKMADSLEQTISDPTCLITEQFFSSVPEPANPPGCSLLGRHGSNESVATADMEQPLIMLGHGDVLRYETSGRLFKDRLKLKVNEAEVVSPVATDWATLAFVAKPTVYSIVKLFVGTTPSHYFISTHAATLVYDRAQKRFCEFYIPGDSVRFFQSKHFGLTAARLHYDAKGSPSVRLSLIDLRKLCN